MMQGFALTIVGERVCCILGQYLRLLAEVEDSVPAAHAPALEVIQVTAVSAPVCLATSAAFGGNVVHGVVPTS